MSTLESLSFPKREYCTASAGKMSSTAHDGKWATQLFSQNPYFLLEAHQVLLARGGPGVGRVRPQLRVPAWLVWRVEVSVKRGQILMISLSSQVRLQPRSGPRHQTRGPDPVCPRPPQVTSWGHVSVSITFVRVHCNKELIVICVETPSSGGGHRAHNRRRRSPDTEQELFSLSEYNHIMSDQDRDIINWEV